MKGLYFLISVLTLSFSAFTSPDAHLEQLMGVSVDETTISFQVSSNGCTYRRDFDFLVEEKLEQMGPDLPAFEHHYYISVKRTRPDNCENYSPNGTHLNLSFDELGIQFGKFHVVNPIGGEKIIAVPKARR